MTEVIGSSNALISPSLDDTAAHTTPNISASINPPIILSDEYKTACQKSAVAIISTNISNVLTGDERISSELK